MLNEIKLQEGHPVDENLRPIKVGGKTTAIETAQHGNGARVNGDLEVTGNIKGNVKDVELDLTKITSTDLIIDDSGDIELNADGGDITFKDNLTPLAAFSQGDLKIYYDASNLFRVSTSSAGVVTLSSAGGTPANADFTIDAGGDIVLDAGNGVFEAKNAGTQFSADKSAYAGMMLGCTHVFGSGTAGVFVTTSTAWENLLWDTDKFALVTFVVPPSNRVKISVHLPYILANSYAIQLGLATNDTPTSLGTKYENDVDDANRPDSFNLNYSWVVNGSDHSWSAGETKTIYIMAYTSNSVRFYTGGTNTSGYGGVIVEATALPATIGDGSEP
mgnify:CR=1 FL=1